MAGNTRMCVCVCVCVWMLVRVAQIVTAAHRDLWSCMHRPTQVGPSDLLQLSKSPPHPQKWVRIGIFELAELHSCRLFVNHISLARKHYHLIWLSQPNIVECMFNKSYTVGRFLSACGSACLYLPINIVLTEGYFDWRLSLKFELVTEMCRVYEMVLVAAVSSWWRLMRQWQHRLVIYSCWLSMLKLSIYHVLIVTSLVSTWPVKSSRYVPL